MNSLSQRSSGNSAVPETGNGAISDTKIAFGPFLEDLETSLRSSQWMLLHRQVELLQQETDHQLALAQKISARLSHNPNNADFVQVPRASAQRVLQLGRVHLALLIRMQQFVTVSSNRTANSAATYDAYLKNRRALPAALRSPQSRPNNGQP